MTDAEIIQSMTEAMRMLDKTIESLENIEVLKSKNEINDTCPFCRFLCDVIETDLKKLNDVRVRLIELSRSKHRDERLIVATAVETIAVETKKRYGILKAFIEIAHNEASEILKTRFGEINLNDNPEIKEALINMIKNNDQAISFSHSFDPSKAN